MSEIKMSYIFIEKKKHESKRIKTILLEIIDGIVEDRKDNIIWIDEVAIEYRIIQKRNSKRCFLEIVSNERINKSIPVIQKIDNAIFSSNQQKYYHSIRDYDGVSENFCKKLYPKYAEFERKLRSMLLFILTKAYGSNWRTETVTEETLAVIKENAHGNVSLNTVLENMDLATLEAYLFEKREVNYLSIIDDKLSPSSLEILEKDEICEIIDAMRPTSLWERQFTKFGSQEYWEEAILGIHNTRNKVAHQKTITIEEYRDVNRKINSINRKLTNTIEGIREENFTEYSIVDILGNFTTLVESICKNVMQSQEFMDVVLGFRNKLQEIAKPIAQAYKNSLVEPINKISRMYMDMSWGQIQPTIIKNATIIEDIVSMTPPKININIPSINPLYVEEQSNVDSEEIVEEQTD